MSTVGGTAPRIYYQDADCTLWLGDCLEVMGRLPDSAADLVVMDPPYFLPAVHYAVRSTSARSLSDLSILEYFYRDIFTVIRRVLKPTGFAYVFCDGQSYPVFYAMAYKHYRALRPLVWDKNVSVNGYSWRHQHELILFCESPDAPHVASGDGDVLRCRAVPIEQRRHPAEKPVSLLRRLIHKSAKADSVVLDPFAGSGTTGEAACAEGCQFIGIESDPDYAALLPARLAAVSLDRFGQAPLPLDVAG